MSAEFRALVAHFFGRFFDRDSRTAESDAYTGVIQLLALLMMPGLLLAFYVIMEPPSAHDTLNQMWRHIGDRYVLICYSMVATGLVMTLKWDSLFPDRRDYLILSALPISARRMFAAKVTALSGFLLMFILAVNFCSMAIVPWTYPNPSHSWSWTVQVFLAHGAAVFGASIFTALLFASLQGVLIAILSPAAFRRVSPRIQTISITILVITFLTLPLFKEGIRALSEQYPDGLGYFPFIWFLGLYEAYLPGEWLMPAAFAWARTAIFATGSVGAICAGFYILGYRRHAKKTLESIDSDALTPLWWQRWAMALLNRTLLRDPFQRATFYFVGKIANRSPRHRIITTLYMGAGIALAASFAFIFDPKIVAGIPFRLSPLGATEATVMLSFLIVTGLRATFNVPADLEANWIFQITSGRAPDYLSAVRKWVFTCRILPVYWIIGSLEFYFFNSWTAVSHIIVDLVLSAILIEAFFFNFNKVPFTCPQPRDKFRLAALAIGYFYAFVTFVVTMGVLKRWIAEAPGRLIAFLILSTVVWSIISWIRRHRSGGSARLVYREVDVTRPLSIAGDQGYWQTSVTRRKTARAGLLFDDAPAIPFRTLAEQTLQDIRFGIRILWKSPGVSMTAIILLAIVIGGNITIYSIVHTLITRPAPGITAGHLYFVAPRTKGDPFMTYADYVDYASQSRTMQGLVASTPQKFSLRSGAGTEAFWGEAVSANYFEGLGIPVVRGRSLKMEADRSSASSLPVVISYRVWQETFHASEETIGRNIELSGLPATIVGVATASYAGTNLAAGSEIWIPLVSYGLPLVEERLQDRSNRGLGVVVVGQLAPTASLAEAQSEIATISQRLEAAYPATNRSRRMMLVPYSLTGFGFADGAPNFLRIFSVVTVLTLTIVCANVANLMLARAVVRQRETAVRQSFGASALRILRMLAVEGLAISLAGWIAACSFSYWVSKGLTWLIPSDIRNPRGVRMATAQYIDFMPDWSVLGYAMLLALIGTIVFTIAPALRTLRQEVLPNLKAGEPSVAQGRSNLAGILVVLQLAFSILLLTSAGLAYRSLGLMNSPDKRFDQPEILLATIDPGLNSRTRDTYLELLERVRKRIQAVHGVDSVSYVRMPPPASGIRRAARGFDSKDFQSVQLNYIGPDYLRVLHLTPLMGHDLSAADGSRSPKSAIIDQDLAAALWPGQSAIGQPMVLDGEPAPVEVIAVVQNDALNCCSQGDRRLQHVLLAEQQDRSPLRFESFGNVGRPGEAGHEMTLYIRYSGKLDPVASAITAALDEPETRVPLVYMRTMKRQLAFVTFGARAVTILLTAFSVGSLLIAAIGQYAVIAFAMRRRMREFGVRVAMGASPHRIVASVLKEGLVLTGVGLAVGFALSALAATAFKDFLVGVSPTDVNTYLGVFGLLSVTSLLACFLPALRASRIDPLTALRSE